ncbi:hypothetical protein ACE41H_15710 [Paenibacillus enshidis]|uniref:Uncharacterized protein n=1 Tax=Paenibacillus enshidis TaxID=1458439 RepID=A0ABV5AVJ4_9BACL
MKEKKKVIPFISRPVFIPDKSQEELIEARRKKRKELLEQIKKKKKP